MRVFKNKWFIRFARKQRIDDKALCEAVARAGKGLIDADLGGGVIKQRIARPGEGRSGGFRSLVLFRSGERAFFVYGFAKSGRSDIGPDELRAFRELAGDMFGYDDGALARALRSGAITEVKDEQDLSK